MSLDRTIAFVFLLICFLYGYTAFVSMEASLLPFERSMAFLPNTMPKWLSVLGVISAIAVILNTGPKHNSGPKEGDINYRRLQDYKIGQALLLVGAMVVYALILRSAGFLLATTLFLAGGAVILGERHFAKLLPITIGTAVFVWYLVQEVLGVFLRPWPAFIGV